MYSLNWQCIDSTISSSFAGRKFGRIHAGNRLVFEWQQLLIFVVIKSTVNDKLSCMLLSGHDSYFVVVHQKGV